MRCLAVCGMAVPVIDVLITVWLAALNPGYSHARQFISELGEPERPYAWLFLVWSVVYGVLFAGFSVGLYRALRGLPGSWSGFISLLVIAVGSVVGGLFPCDKGCSARTLSGQMHVVAGSVSLVAMMLAPFLFAAAMRRSVAWRRYRAFTLGIGYLLCGLSIWLAFCYFIELTPNLAGAAHRVSAMVWYAWIEVLSWRLWVIAGRPIR